MFIVVLILVITLMQAYLFWRIASLPWFAEGARRKQLWLVALLIWLFFFGGGVLGHDSRGAISSAIESLAMLWLGVLFIASTVMLAVDLATGFGLWAKRYLVIVKVTGLMLAGVLVVVALVQGIRPPVVVQHDVALTGLPPELDGTTLAVLSDMHLGSQLGADWLAERVKQVQELSPDIIVLPGDSFEGHAAPDEALLPGLSEFKAPLGVYAVAGNHEHFGDTEAIIDLLERAGIQWLQDDWLYLVPGLVLAGVDDLTRRWRNGETGDIASVLDDVPEEYATILLSHSPLQVEQAAAAGANLMLSGHTHGGQIWPFGYIVQQFYPYLVGRHEVSGMSLIISRGTGLWGPRMRLWHPSEILLITLRTKSL